MYLPMDAIVRTPKEFKLSRTYNNQRLVNIMNKNTLKSICEQSEEIKRAVFSQLESMLSAENQLLGCLQPEQVEAIKAQLPESVHHRIDAAYAIFRGQEENRRAEERFKNAKLQERKAPCCIRGVSID